MRFIFRGCLLLILLSTLAFSEEDGHLSHLVETNLGFIKNISHEVCQINAKNKDLGSMIGELQENQRFLQREIESLKDSSRTIMDKLDQLIGSNQSDSVPTGGNLENISQKYEKLNTKVKAIGDIIPNLEHAFKQDLLIPQNISVAFSVSEILARDCLEVYQRINSASGLYKIYPDRDLWNGKEVYCKEGYTIILKRQKTLKTHFNRTWVEYMQGFGSPNGEHYIGNNALHILTSGRNQELSIMFVSKYSTEGIYNYSVFRVGNIDTNFKLSVMGFSGNSYDKFSQYNDHMFTTLDKDNDYYDKNTAAMDEAGKGGGWWYGGWSGLWGTYPEKAKLGDGVDLKELTMMIRSN